jgi:hypothetical protein
MLKYEKGLAKFANPFSILAGATGLEPATSDVTGRRSNQLNYAPDICFQKLVSPSTT